MSVITVQSTLLGTDGAALQDLIDNKVEAIKALIALYAPGVGQILKGIRPVGDENIPVPCVMLEARVVNAQMLTTGKYRTYWEIDFVFYQGDDNPEAVPSKLTATGIIFRKLFSNNAKNDLGSANSNNFKTYDGYWLDSEMTRLELSPLMKGLFEPGPKYSGIGFFKLKLETVELV